MPIADIARLLTLAALWGGSFAFMRVAVAALGPLWLAASRVTLAFLALYALALARRDVPALRAHWRDYLTIGIINTALPFALFSFAAQHVTASTAAILNATSPFFATIIAALWLKDRVTPAKIIGMILGMVGVVLLVGWQPEPMSNDKLIAVSACLVAALSYGVASVFAKARLTGLPSFAIALYSQMTAMIVLAPALPFVPPPGSITPLVAANVLALAIASTAIAYMLYFKLIATIGPARALTVTFLIPLFGVLWGFLFLDEKIGANTLAACALIVCGTWLAVRNVRRGRSAHRGPPRRKSDEFGRGSENLLAQFAIARQRGRIDAQILDLGGLQTALLDDLELLIAWILHLLGFARVDDGDDGHVTIADDETHVLVRDLAKRTQPFHALADRS